MATGPPLPGVPAEFERLRAVVSQRFPVYETRITPNSLVLLVHVDPLTLERRFDELRRQMWEMSYIPVLRKEQGEHVVEVIRRPPRNTRGAYVNLALLAVTIASTVSAGAFLWLSWRGGFVLQPSDFFWGGISFGLPLLTILGLHELAHFVMARRHHVEASLPYFIPVPPPYLLFGTFGAFISLREPIPDKKALLDIGASGPLVGFLAAVPVTLGGLVLSAHAAALSPANCGPTVLGFNYGNILVGLPAIWSAFQFVLGVNPASLHPLAFAGWVGILVTAINLLPAGQLDGGHVARALLGPRSVYASIAAIVILIGMGLVYLNWILFALIIVLLGFRHPPPLNDLTPLDRKRVGVGIVAVLLLVTGFVVVPLGSPSGQFALQNQSTVRLTPPPGFAMADNVTMQLVNQDMVARDFEFSTTIGSVIHTVNGTSESLMGPALQAFLANSTWALTLPNGTVLRFHGGGNWTLPTSALVMLDAGDSAKLPLQYWNTQQAAVQASVSARMICAPAAGSPQVQTFTTTFY